MEKFNTINDEGNRRLCEKLYLDLGVEIINFLEDNDVNEIMLNPDGRLWLDRNSKGQILAGHINRNRIFSIMNSVAGLHNFVVSQHSPCLEAELPFYRAMKGERFTGQIPPIVSAPCFTIRKKTEIIFSLDDYLATKRLTDNQALIIRRFIAERKNILVCGGPGSGKTTVTNALIAEAIKFDENQRFIILEDLPELQCAAQNKVALLTSQDIDMTRLLKTAMRMRPDRILIGEVRGKEALDMLKAWNTGCPGGFCTLHANGAEEAVQRISDLAMEAGLVVAPKQLVLHTVDAIISVIRQGNQKGFIHEIITLSEDTNEKFKFNKIT